MCHLWPICHILLTIFIKYYLSFTPTLITDCNLNEDLLLSPLMRFVCLGSMCIYTKPLNILQL